MLFLSVIGFSGIAQHTFRKAYKVQDVHILTKKHVIAPDGSFYIISTENLIVKLDAASEVLWSKQLTEVDNLNDLLVAPNGDVLIGGSIFPSQIYGSDAFVARLTSDGTLLWSRAYDARYGERVDAMALKDGKLHVGGLAESFRALPSEMFYLELDPADGAILKSHGQWTRGRELINDMIVVDDFVVMCGTTYDADPQGDPFLAIIGDSGLFRYLYAFVLPGVQQGTALVNLSTSDAFTMSGDDNDGTFLMKFKDIHTPTEVNYQFYNNGPKVFSHDLAYDELRHQYALAGNTQGAAITQGWLMQVDSGLTNNRAFSYENATTQGFRSVSINQQGHLTFCGSIHLGTPFSEIYLVQSDASGWTGCNEPPYTLTEQIRTPVPTFYYPGTSLWQFQDSIPVITPEDWVMVDSLFCPQLPPVAGFRSDTTACLGDCITFTDTSSFATNWFWSFPGGTPNSFSGATPPNICYNTSGSFPITLVVQNGLGSDTSTTWLTIYELPNVNAGKDTTICAGNIIRLEGSGGVIYDWTPTQFRNTSPSSNPQVWPPFTTTFYLTVTDQNGCSATDSVLVSVLQEPMVLPDAYTLICDQDSVRIEAGVSGFDYLWDNGAVTSYQVVDTAGIYRVNIGNRCFNYTRSFTVNEKNCEPSLFYIPNAFTPGNQDGVNDFFTAVGVEVSVTSLAIYNRWGDLIFKAEGDHVIWDGLCGNVACQQGVYLYQMTLKSTQGESFDWHGLVHLLH